MLLGTINASLLRNKLAGKEINRGGNELIRAGYGSKGSLIKISSKNDFLNSVSSFKYFRNTKILS